MRLRNSAHCRILFSNSELLYCSYIFSPSFFLPNYLSSTLYNNRLKNAMVIRIFLNNLIFLSQFLSMVNIFAKNKGPISSKKAQYPPFKEKSPNFSLSKKLLFLRPQNRDSDISLFISMCSSRARI